MSSTAQSPRATVASFGAVELVLCAPLRLFSSDGRFLVGWVVLLWGAPSRAEVGSSDPVLKTVGVEVVGCREAPPVEVIFRAMIRIGDPIPVPAPLNVVIEGCGMMTIAVIARAVMRSGAPAAMWHSTWRAVVAPRCVVL